MPSASCAASWRVATPTTSWPADGLTPDRRGRRPRATRPPSLDRLDSLTDRAAPWTACPYRPVAHRVLPRGHRAHGPLQLALRPATRRHLRCPGGGHRLG